MKKIDALIIGAQKAGTTSLKNYLAQHDMIKTHEVIEFPYFKDIEEYRKGYSKSLINIFQKFQKRIFFWQKAQQCIMILRH